MTLSEVCAIRARRHFPRWPTSTQRRIMRWSKMSKEWHIVHQNPHFQGQEMQRWHQQWQWVNVLQDSHWQHAKTALQNLENPALSWIPVSALVNFTGSNHEYTFSWHTAVGNSAHWLHLSTFPHVEDTLPRIPQGSSKPCQTVHPWMPVHILTICTWRNREYRLFWAQYSGNQCCSADWLHLDTFSPMTADLPRSGRLLNTWKTGFAIRASWCSSHLYWIKPWIQTCWSNWSGTQCWLTRSEYLSTCVRCSTNDQKVHQHLENRFRHEVKSMFWRFILNQTMNRDFLIQLQWHTVLTDWIWIFFHVRKLLYQRPEGSSTPGNPVLPRRKVNVLAINSESNHEYRLSDPTAVVHNADWIDLNTFPPVKDAPPSTRRFINTWKKWFHREGNSMF